MIEIQFEKKLHTSAGNINFYVDLKIETNTFNTISGKSGSGKTTFLRILAGLTNPDKGLIKINGNEWFSTQRKINLTPQKRKIGFVFQDYALFPNFTVLKNLLYVNKDRDEVYELLEKMDLLKLSMRYPDTLSGGQKQRVALARAIARKPEILLLDEPLSALDGEMRLVLQDEIARISRNIPVTIILVSHDIPEIFKLSDRVLLLENGKIIGDGPPEEIFGNSILSSKFSFIGEIIKIIKADIVYVAYIAIGNSISEIIISEGEAKNLKSGDKVLVASKAFNPIIKKI